MCGFADIGLSSIYSQNSQFFHCVNMYLGNVVTKDGLHHHNYDASRKSTAWDVRNKQKKKKKRIPAYKFLEM